MKRISIVFTLALVALVSAYSRTPYKSKGQKAQTSKVQKAQTITQSNQQEAQKAIQEGRLGRIASKANNSLRNYPSSPQIRKIGDPKTRSILERGRKLLEAGKAATGWNATQLSDFVGQLDQYLKEAEYVAEFDNNPTGGTKQEECGKAKDKCNDKCRGQGGGLWCFIDCRLEYLTCLAGTIFNRSFTTRQ